MIEQQEDQSVSAEVRITITCSLVEAQALTQWLQQESYHFNTPPIRKLMGDFLKALTR